MKRWLLSAGFWEPVVLGALALGCLPNIVARMAAGDPWVFVELLAGTGTLAVVCLGFSWLTYERPPAPPAVPATFLESFRWTISGNHHIQPAASGRRAWRC